MDFGLTSISRAKIFCFRSGFLRIRTSTALITCGVRAERGRPEQWRSFMSPVLENNLMARYTKFRKSLSGCSVLNIFFSFIPRLNSAMTAMRFSLSVHSMATTIPILNLFGVDTIHMSLVKNHISISGCVPSFKSYGRVFTCTSTFVLPR